MKPIKTGLIVVASIMASGLLLDAMGRSGNPQVAGFAQSVTRGFGQ